MGYLREADGSTHRPRPATHERQRIPHHRPNRRTGARSQAQLVEITELVTDADLLEDAAGALQHQSIADAIEDGIDTYSVNATPRNRLQRFRRTHAQPGWRPHPPTVDCLASPTAGDPPTASSTSSTPARGTCRTRSRRTSLEADPAGKLDHGIVEVCEAPASAGFLIEEVKLAVFTEAELLGRRGTYSPRGAAGQNSRHAAATLSTRSL